MLGTKQKAGFNIPFIVSDVTAKLQKVGFEAFLVGGCVRDLLRGARPKDWDITTNARPEDILKLFPDSFYENEFGTVGIVNENSEDESLKVIEVTTYRLEATYSDSRHPDRVDFSDLLHDDLKRRDFTINAMAFDVSQETIVDPYEGGKDLQEKTIRAVGDPSERFKEDGLRLMRAARLAVELDFSISYETIEAIVKQAESLKKIAGERIRDEFVKIIESPRAMQGILLCHRLGLLTNIIPDLERGIDIKQNQAHAFDVWEHNLRTMQHAVDKGWPLNLRLAGLFHDIAKPQTRKWSPEKNDWTFHGHDYVGEKVTFKALTDLKFPKKTIENIAKLVRWHMFFSDPEKITLSAVRRLIRNVGQENVWDLMNLRICDRIGTGRPKEQPYRFRKYKSMIEEALHDPISVSMLKIDGRRIMDLLELNPGPKIGLILHALLEEVLDDPSRNTESYLDERAQELASNSEDKLMELGKLGKAKKVELEGVEVKKIRQKYGVQ
jgi:tRNA nucleotidyltransferase (CCA-adding enzyme)